MPGLALPVPAQVSPGNYLTAALWNATVYNGLTFLLNPPLFVGTQSAAQSIANNTVTSIAMDSTVIDTHAGHSDTTNNSRYTIQVAGWYEITGLISLAANATGNRIAQVAKNGSTINLGGVTSQLAPGAANGAVYQVKCTALLAVNDYIEIQAYQSSGGALSTNAGASGLVVRWVHA